MIMTTSEETPMVVKEVIEETTMIKGVVDMIIMLIKVVIATIKITIPEIETTMITGAVGMKDTIIEVDLMIVGTEGEDINRTAHFYHFSNFVFHIA